MENSKTKSTSIAVLGVFTAIVVVLQLLSYVVKIGTFNLSLVLIPIVVGGVMYGPKVSAILGAAFGIVTFIAAATGLDAGAYIMFAASPILTFVICILKATLCGYISGLTAKLIHNKTISVFAAAAVAPIVNTGVFIVFSLLCFKDILYSWAGGTNLVSYILLGLVGVNFLIELGINLIFSPSIMKIIKAVKRI